MYLSYSLKKMQKNDSYVSKIALVGFQYEPVCLVVGEVCFDEEQNISNTSEHCTKPEVFN